MNTQLVSALIDQSPMNRGAKGDQWLRTRGNIAITYTGPLDVILFERQATGVYEFHWLTIQSKPREAVRRSLEAIDQTFIDTGCQLMFGLVPSDRRDSRLMARWIGAKHIGRVASELGECEMYIMTREMREGARHGISQA